VAVEVAVDGRPKEIVALGKDSFSDPQT